jgi:hypothetical protein
MGTLMPTIPDLDIELKLPRRAAVLGEDRHAVAVGIFVDEAQALRHRCRRGRR